MANVVPSLQNSFSHFILDTMDYILAGEDQQQKSA